MRNAVEIPIISIKHLFGADRSLICTSIMINKLKFMSHSFVDTLNITYPPTSIGLSAAWAYSCSWCWCCIITLHWISCIREVYLKTLKQSNTIYSTPKNGRANKRYLKWKWNKIKKYINRDFKFFATIWKE